MKTITKEVAWPTVPERYSKSSLREFINELFEELTANPEADIYFHGGGDDSDIECTIVVERPETAEEIAAREKKAAEAAREREEEERREFERLKAKFLADEKGAARE